MQIFNLRSHFQHPTSNPKLKSFKAHFAKTSFKLRSRSSAQLPNKHDSDADLAHRRKPQSIRIKIFHPAINPPFDISQWINLIPTLQSRIRIRYLSSRQTLDTSRGNKWHTYYIRWIFSFGARIHCKHRT